MSEKYTTIHYHNYLGLDKILNAQELRSEQLDEKPAHEEMLFIIIHQVYELWFKQIIHELESVLTEFQTDDVDEKKLGTAIGRLNRVREILKVLIQQITVLETMTPLDFLDFRNHLFPASGFQSYQFRLVENLLGLPEKQRITYSGCPYFSVFDEGKQKELREVEVKGTLFRAVESWLERTPFLDFKDFNFLEEYKKSVQRMIARERNAIQASGYLTESEIAQRLQMLGNTDTYFQNVFEEKVHQKAVEEGKVRLSYRATVAALFINLYRDEPILHLPYRLLNCLIDIDEGFTTWRYRHAQMVQRMLGNKIGTGGSSGFDYLVSTAEKHPIFIDFHKISTLLIPRTELPKLPDDLVKALSYHYTFLNKW